MTLNEFASAWNNVATIHRFEIANGDVSILSVMNEEDREIRIPLRTSGASRVSGSYLLQPEITGSNCNRLINWRFHEGLVADAGAIQTQVSFYCHTEPSLDLFVEVPVFIARVPKPFPVWVAEEMDFDLPGKDYANTTNGFPFHAVFPVLAAWGQNKMSAPIGELALLEQRSSESPSYQLFGLSLNKMKLLTVAPWVIALIQVYGLIHLFQVRGLKSEDISGRVTVAWVGLYPTWHAAALVHTAGSVFPIVVVSCIVYLSWAESLKAFLWTLLGCSSVTYLAWLTFRELLRIRKMHLSPG